MIFLGRNENIGRQVLHVEAAVGQEVGFAYERSGLTNLLRRFGLNMPFKDTSKHPALVTEAYLNRRLAIYAAMISPLAISDGKLDVSPLKTAFALVVDDMNMIGEEGLGVPKRPNIPRAVLQRAGVVGPNSPPVRFPYYDDRFWNQQFPSDFYTQRVVARIPGDTKEEYLVDYFAYNLREFAVSPFSSLPQTVREAQQM